MKTKQKHRVTGRMGKRAKVRKRKREMARGKQQQKLKWMRWGKMRIYNPTYKSL